MPQVPHGKALTLIGRASGTDLVPWSCWFLRMDSFPKHGTSVACAVLAHWRGTLELRAAASPGSPDLVILMIPAFVFALLVSYKQLGEIKVLGCEIK